MQRPPVVIFVHGAWHGPWAWAPVIERLTAEGLRTIAVDLPSKGFETALLGDLHDDAEAVRAVVDAAGGPALVVAHSYGGLPVSEGLAGCANAAHLIYLAAFMLERGQSLLGLRGGVEPDWWIASEDGRTYLPGDPKRVFFNDCPPAVAERAAAALLPQRKDAFTQETFARGLGGGAFDLRRLRARQCHPARRAGAHGGACRHGQPRRRRPCGLPVAPARGHGDRPGDARGGRGERPAA